MEKALKNPLLRALGPLAGWSLFIWITRVRNIWTDDELSTTGQVGRGLIAAAFIIGGMAMVAFIVRGWSRGLDGRQRWMVAVFSMFSIVYWIARAVQILAADHSAGFKAVHAVLGIVSVAVAGRALNFIKRSTPAMSPRFSRVT